MDNPIISVIVPIYNAENYLSRCIDSIISQTFTNFELLLIDDGSTDNSGRICNDYANKDKRIKVFHKKNEGVSSSRNVGINNANGEWITFIDSDDYISNIFFQEFYQNHLKYSFEYFQGNVEQTSISGKKMIEYSYPNIICSLADGVLKYNLLQTGDPHAKFFLQSILNKYKIRFTKDISYGEDRLFINTYFCHINIICLSSTICYHYLRVPNSLSMRLNSFESEYLCMQLMSKVIINLSQKINVNYVSILNNTFTYRTLITLVQQKNIKFFKEFLSKSNPIDLYLINDVCKNLIFGNIFSWLLREHHNKILFLFLKSYFKLKSIL